MLDIDILDLIPDTFKQQIRDSLVDTLAATAERLRGEKVARAIRLFRSDAAFLQRFEAGLQHAARRFVDEYESVDEDLVYAIAADREFFKNRDVQSALLTMLRNPSAYLVNARDALTQSFAGVMPDRKNRERVDRAVAYLLKCLAEELWHLPEFQPIYSLQFQRMTAEATRQQVEIQKAQLHAIAELSSSMRDALLQLTDAIAERRLLSSGDMLALPMKPRIFHNLPQPDYARFVGRESEMDWLRERLSPRDRAWQIAITGIGGVGKSALAQAIAHEYRQRFDALPEDERFDAIVWVSAKEEVLTTRGREEAALPGSVLRTLEDVYAAIAQALEREDITRSAPDEQSRLVEKALRAQRTLLIMDNLESVTDDRVKPFLRRMPAPTKVVITSREWVDVADVLSLTGMRPEEAERLIVEEAHVRSVTLDQEQRKRIIDLTSGLPLPMKLSVARVASGETFAVVARWLGDASGDVPEYCVKGQADLTRQREPDAWRMLLACSLFDRNAGASREALGSVADLSIADRDKGLAYLQRLFLVNRTEGDRFWLLPIVQRYVSVDIEQAEFKRPLIRRWLDYLRVLCKDAAEEGEYYWRYRSYAFFDEGPNLLEAIPRAREYGTAEDVFALTLAAYEYLEIVGRWSDMLVLVDSALNLARLVPDSRHISRFANAKGWILKQVGDYQVAIDLFSESLAECRRSGNADGESITLQHLSAAYRKLGEFARAKELSDQAWQIADGLGLGDLKALINTERGKRARDMGDWDAAWSYFSEVNRWFEERTEQTPRDEPLARSTWGHLAIVAYHLGRFDEAKELCLRSLDFFEVHGTKGYLATLKYRLALAENALGEYDSAYQHAREAVSWFDRLGMKPDHAEAVILLEAIEQHFSVAPE